MNVTDPASTVGLRVAKILQDRGIPQARVGEVLGIAQSQVSRRLSGEIAFDISELAALGEYLAIPLGELLDVAA